MIEVGDEVVYRKAHMHDYFESLIDQVGVVEKIEEGEMLHYPYVVYFHSCRYPGKYNCSAKELVKEEGPVDIKDWM